MLNSLHIENIAVIEKADVAFSKGFNVLTGETGAGKSIVIDAIGAILGGRASKELVRTGAENALVSAEFSLTPAAEQWLSENGIESEDDSLYVLRRISSEGKNSCRINGNPVPVSQLRELGSLLIGIHGQNDGQRLLSESSHRAYLDAFGQLEPEMEKYRTVYDRVRSIRSELDELAMDERERERRIDQLERSIAELERAELVPGEWAEKSARRDLMQNSKKFMDAVEIALGDLDGEETAGVNSLIFDAEHVMASVRHFAPELTEIHRRLEELRYAAEDITETLRDFRDSMDYSVDELDALEGRLDQLRRLSRKYGGDETEMLAYLEQSKDELNTLAFSNERRAELEQKFEKEEALLTKAAAVLTNLRRAAGNDLATRILDELRQLSMPGVRFETAIEPDELGPYGADSVSFLMSANAGEKPGKISKIASGGELARIMLAMKTVLAAGDSIDTMIFDEIDTGVSGIAAQRVGEKLYGLADERQVICVTHLPQIAVLADGHYLIEKKIRDGRTYTELTALDRSGRKNELARLTSGETLTPMTLAAAEDLLKAADEYKSKTKTDSKTKRG